MPAAPTPHRSQLTTHDSAWTDRYLALLGLQREAPSLDALTRIVKAHVLRVSFENVTALLRWRDHQPGPAPQPDLDALLTNWEQRSGGGICFELAAMLAQLLASLGYEIHIALAQVSLPNGHQAIHITLDGRRYIVDLGTGGPFFQPIPLDHGPFEIHSHGLGFRFRFGDQPHQYVQERLIDGAWTAHARYDLRPSVHADRDRGYQHHHTANASWVTNSLTLIHSTDAAVYSLKDDTLVRYTAGGKETTILTGPADYRHVAAEIFEMPALPIEEALAVRAELAARAAAASTR